MRGFHFRSEELQWDAVRRCGGPILGEGACVRSGEHLLEERAEPNRAGEAAD